MIQYIGLDDTTKTDSVKLPFPFKDESEFPYYQENKQSPLFLNNPSNIHSEIQYNTETGEYEFVQKIGKMNYRPTGTMSFDEYRKYDFENSLHNYWQQRFRSESFEHQGALIPKLYVGSEVFDRIFGSNTIDIKPQGSAELIFGIVTNKVDNPALPIRQQKNTTFDFKEKIQMNVTGKIGDNLQLGINYDTEATFEFENKTNLKFEGKEDDIIQKIEAGDVIMPLTGSLISGSQTLFGFLTELQFGKLSVTTVMSQQKGETSVIEVEGGAQRNEFELYADEYDANRHFFLAHYFKDTYEKSLDQLPQIRSGLNITRIEVWITNKRADFQKARNILAFQDLAETEYYLPYDESSLYYDPQKMNIFAKDFIRPTGLDRPYPTDSINSLESEIIFDNIRSLDTLNTYMSQFATHDFVLGQDYEMIESARLLDATEYSVNNALGYISLNQALNADEVLAVAYEYTINGRTYKVGELSSDGIEAPKTLVVKLLKGTNLSPGFNTWELMMKNVYAIGGYQIKPIDFKFEILYYDDETGAPLSSIKEGKIANKRLLHVFNLDNLTSTGAQTTKGDNVFDFVENVTIDTRKGRIFFTELYPFGKDLAEEFDDSTIANKYIYQELYDLTQSAARQIAEKNKFILKGEYQSSSSNEIALNAFNIPRGSVKVSANGRNLIENEDFTVDYMLGRVKILDQGLLASGIPIQVVLESNSLFSMQSKSLIGTHLDYRFNEDMHLGATVMNLTEKPITKKVNIGEEPISNTIWGFNGSIRHEVPFITRMIDKIPLLETKEISTITVNAEFAHLIPGHSRALEKEGVSYIDDFEGSKSTIDIKSPDLWFLASTPQGQTDLFPETEYIGSLKMGFGRAKLAWYRIDPLFTERNSPVDIELQSNPNVYEVKEQDLFPFRETQNGIPTRIPVLNVSYYPAERGPYNYDTDHLNINGDFDNPNDRWAGVMRKINTNDFEEANVEFIEFWMMDPFWNEDEENMGGELYFNLGNISEDILNDGRKSFEDGMPADGDITKTNQTVWGRVPAGQALEYAFETNTEARKNQDIGLDGLKNVDEQEFFDTVFLKKLEASNPAAYKKVFNDPSSDDFKYFRSSDYDDQDEILFRYKNYNGHEGNSPTSDQSDENYSTSGTTRPDVEDINRDYTLSQNESYYQYKVLLTPEALSDENKGKNYITDIRYTPITFNNKDQMTVRWIQFKIPIYKPDKVIGTIDDFKSIRFLRMFLKNFDKETHLRFAEMDLVRGEWRKYNFALWEEHESLIINTEPTASPFDVSVVNIEENGYRIPVSYVLPPGIDRVTDPSNPQLRQLNEQSLSLKVESLVDGYSKAVYKNVYLDVRQYKKMQIEVHAEALDELYLEDYEVSAFIRLGSDYQDNFYEYEIPLKLTEHLPSGGRYKTELYGDQLKVWPDTNRIDFEFLILQEIKKERNSIGHDITSIYTKQFGGARVSIKGNPNLSNVKTIMIGVRNPLKDRDPLHDDGNPKSAEVWFNELRLTDFLEYGGWAANTQIVTKLADFGTVTFSANKSTPGFGSIEKKVNERSKEDLIQYDISSNFELGKFFPEKAKVNIPMHLGISESQINPLYDPLDQDIELKATLNTLKTDSARRAYLDMAQTYSKRRSINFTNVRVQPRKGKSKFYSLSNWTATYAYNDYYSRNINTEWNYLKNYNGTLSYNYNKRPKNIAPFRKSALLKWKYLKIIKDFNFYYLPSSFSFRTNMARKFNEVKLRNINNLEQDFDPTWDREFRWSRVYNFKYDITKSLKFDFSANNLSDVLELSIDDIGTDFDHLGNKELILESIKMGGKNYKYDHRFNLAYTIPINKFPLFDWVSSSVRYSGTYIWEASLPYLIIDEGTGLLDKPNPLGNTIRNSNSINGTLRLNMSNFYNKVGYLKEVNNNIKKRSRQGRKKREVESVTYEMVDVKLKAKIPKIILHKLRTEEIEVKAMDRNKKPVKGEFKIINENRATFTAEENADSITIIVIGEREIIDSPLKIVFEYSLGAIMGIKDISITYAENRGTVLPGYMEDTKFFGMANSTGRWNPGIRYIAGFQDLSIVDRIKKDSLLTRDITVLNPFLTTNSVNFNLRSTIEPLPGLRINVTAIKNESKTFETIYVYESDGVYRNRNNRTTGSFTISTIAWRTAFGDIDDNNNSQAFNRLISIMPNIAGRYADERRIAYNKDKNDDYEYNIVDSLIYQKGYSGTSQEVLITSFIAAYTGQDIDGVKLSSFPRIPLPNWKLTYDGLAKIEFIKQYLRSVNVNHSYSGTYSLSGYETDAKYIEDIEGYSLLLDNGGMNFLSENIIGGVSLSEQFSPLIGVDMTWNNSLISKIEIKKNRSINFSLINNQLTETIGNDLVIGSGYRFKDVELIIKSGGRSRPLKSDLNVRADLTFRKLISITRKLDDKSSEVTGGQDALSIKFSADYILSERFNLRVFYDRVSNTPKTGAAFKTSTGKFGLSIRFTLI